MTDKKPWFVERRLGRRELVHWKGALAFAALIALLFAGGAVESTLRPSHPVLAFALMVPLAVAAFWIVAVIIDRTGPRD